VECLEARPAGESPDVQAVGPVPAIDAGIPVELGAEAGGAPLSPELFLVLVDGAHDVHGLLGLSGMVKGRSCCQASQAWRNPNSVEKTAIRALPASASWITQQNENPLLIAQAITTYLFIVDRRVLDMANKFGGHEFHDPRLLIVPVVQ
jgi:hypothetical protein